MTRVLSILIFFLCGIVSEISAQINILKQKALTGDVESQYNVGVCYLKGKGTNKNPSEAVVWFQNQQSKGMFLL